MSYGYRSRLCDRTSRTAHEPDISCVTDSSPGCTHTRFLDGHHWRHWLHGGETSLAKLLLLCPFHHGLVHEGGWSVERDEEGRFTFVAPTGKNVGTEAREEWHGEVETLVREWDEGHGLEIGPETNEPLWDGAALDYDVAVSGLVARSKAWSHPDGRRG